MVWYVGWLIMSYFWHVCVICGLVDYGAERDDHGMIIGMEIGLVILVGKVCLRFLLLSRLVLNRYAKSWSEVLCLSGRL